MRSLLRSLVTIDKKNKYIIVTDINYGSWGLEGVEEIVVSSVNPLFWIVWSNTILPRLLDERKVDIYHSLKHVNAFCLRAKKVVTFHGIHSHYILPQVQKWHNTVYWKSVASMAVKTYDRIITVAQGEKNYFVKKLGFPEEMFKVTHLAAHKRFRVIEDKKKLQDVKKKYQLPDTFILFVGIIDPIKNFEGIIRGYYKAKDNLKNNPKLVLVGDKDVSYFQKIYCLIKKLGITNDIIWLGHIYDDLPYIYNLAEILLHPSHYEACSIVLLEAMACGLPIVTSNFDDIKTLVGNAALLVDPKNTSQIAQAIVTAFSSNQIRLLLTQKGLERSKLFSWDNCARETIKIYEELIHG